MPLRAYRGRARGLVLAASRAGLVVSPVDVTPSTPQPILCANAGTRPVMARAVARMDHAAAAAVGLPSEVRFLRRTACQARVDSSTCG
jgi:hypothetical protein